MKVLAVLSFAVLAAAAPQEDPKKRDAVKKALEEMAKGTGALDKLSVTWDDLHGLHGGLRLKVEGSGRITQEAVRTNVGTPREKVDPKDLRRLVDALIAHEAWIQRVPERTPVPDESRARLTITVGDASSTVWERYNDLVANKRLVEIRDLLQKIAWK